VFAQEYTEPELNIKQTKVQEGIESLRVCRPIRGKVHFSDVDAVVGKVNFSANRAAQPQYGFILMGKKQVKTRKKASEKLLI
jgi:hypothetical protein